MRNRRSFPSALLIAAAVVALGASPAAAQAPPPYCGPADVAFVIDDTFSTGPVLASLQASLTALLDEIAATTDPGTGAGPDYRLSLVTFKDNITVRLNFAANNRDAIVPLVNALAATAGGSGSGNASDEALNTVVNALPAGTRPQNIDFTPAFRTGTSVRRIIILMTGYQPGGFDDNFTQTDITNAHQRALEAAAKGIKIGAFFTLVFEAQSGAVPVMEDYATTTGGYYIRTDQPLVDPAQAVIDYLSSCTPTNKPPRALCGDTWETTAPPKCSAVPSSIDAGSYDPEDGVNISIVQTPPGPYNVGATLVTLTATDTQGLSASCQGTVTVDCATAKPDVSIVASDPSATEAGRTTGTFTVARTGSTSASLTVLYTVGGTATPGLDYTALSGSVVIPAGASAAPIVVTPILDKLVEVESVVVTLATDAAYNITPPGAATVTISDGPDMMVSALTAPASGGSGGTITVGATTKNAGNGPADASVTRVYFSLNDSKLDVADQLITTIAIPALAPAGTYPSTFSFTIPASTPSGTHYLIAVSDALKTLPETKETNNQKNKKILVGPDLYISALTTSTTTVAAGGTMTLTETTKDTVGASPVTIATTTRVYLSLDNSVGAGDVVLSARTVPTLASGGHSVYTHTLQIPAGISGTRYLIVLADADNALWETKETNNKKTKTITITP